MSSFDEWFGSLPVERRRILIDDKWMLANAAFTHVQAERDALSVTINRLRMAIQSNCYDDPSTSGKRLIELANSIPQQHLAAHDAEVAKKAVQAALRMYGNTDLSNKEIIALSENYAASLNK